MSESQSLPYTLQPEQKVASVMVYMSHSIAWGEVVVREITRVSTWLRTNSAPDDICLYNARLQYVAAGTFKPIFFREAHILTASVLAFHLLPPASDPLDYDPSEPNRRMEPVTSVVGNFRMDGFMRISTHADLTRYLDVAKETYLPLYNAEISSPILPGFGVVKVPYVIVRMASTIFATRNLPVSPVTDEQKVP